ncbi:MAG: outer membrane beta-barrel protein [Nitrospirae bacterium]|nr:outer membrane beta-barrel protein [Candidatus Manganitrophaceae bacterium]
MKKSMSVFSLFAAGAMVVGGAGLSHADDLKVSGFGSINFNLMDEASDNSCSDTSGTDGSTNCTELQFSVPYAEVDFEKTVGSVTVRLDLDFNGTGNNIAGDDVEQFRFDWTLPAGQDLGLTLTGGIFNSPIGFESQDSPDKLQVSNGQLFNMVPSNLAGLQLAGGTDMISGSLLFVNDWRDFGTGTNPPGATQSLGEENTLGATFAITPMPEAGLSFGYLSSGLKPNEDTLNIILTGTVMPSPDLALLYALEYVSNEKQDGKGITLNAMHGKHGLTLRYDMVDNDGAAGDPTSLTVAFLCSLEENLKVKLEWRDDDPDVAGASSTDATTLQFVALF